MARKGEGSSSVKRFADCAVAMRNILYNDATLSEAESIFIEKHFQVLEMAFFRWKQKRTPHPSALEKGTEQSKAA
jgi:hypothetical protein